MPQTQRRCNDPPGAFMCRDRAIIHRSSAFFRGRFWSGLHRIAQRLDKRARKTEQFSSI